MVGSGRRPAAAQHLVSPHAWRVWKEGGTVLIMLCEPTPQKTGMWQNQRQMTITEPRLLVRAERGVGMRGVGPSPPSRQVQGQSLFFTPSFYLGEWKN